MFTVFKRTAYTDTFGRRILFILTSFSLFLLKSSIKVILHFDAYPINLVGAELLSEIFGAN